MSPACGWVQRVPFSKQDAEAIRVLLGAQYCQRLTDDELDALQALQARGVYSPLQREWFDRLWERVMG